MRTPQQFRTTLTVILMVFCCWLPLASRLAPPVAATSVTLSHPKPIAATVPDVGPAAQKPSDPFGKLPLHFVESNGAQGAMFTARTPNIEVGITSSAALMRLRSVVKAETAVPPARPLQPDANKQSQQPAPTESRITRLKDASVRVKLVVSNPSAHAVGLLSKKAAKKIASGQTVVLRVSNPSGLTSAPFSYAAP